MKISIITVVLNGAGTIEDCIRSVASQRYPDIEHIIVDGGSTDATVEIIKKCEKLLARWVSEPDNGLYTAMNKGITMATGDIIGILNADDVYDNNHVIEDVVAAMNEANADSCYADLVYVDRGDTTKIVRHWISNEFFAERFKIGWMPPHPSFFVRRSVYEKYGLFNTEFPLAADYELMLRFLYKHKISTTYLRKILVKMRAGGKSNPGIITTARCIRENYRSWKVNGLKTTPLTFILKPLRKFLQYF